MYIFHKSASRSSLLILLKIILLIVIGFGLRLSAGQYQEEIGGQKGAEEEAEGWADKPLEAIILSELQKISASLKSIDRINEKLIKTLRANRTHYGFKSLRPEELVSRGYRCTQGIGWHKYNRDEISWNEARKSCRKDDAHLAVPNSPKEAQAMKKMLLENNQFSAYIGIHNQFKEDEWVTVFGDPLAETGYNRWSVGPPKISEANCGVMFEDGKLLGIPCHAKRSYFCEIPGIPNVSC